ncbi:DUF461 domain-containing protein [Streptomyces anandii]|uniref:DUF461 domain-containing protein n=1 Tax=Streptomyces anandii TaxID=285454 RepID=UPI0016777967|nr:DUF461 domain-containing protein [Streptomyces anandii]GGX88361.1 lipoprotein [Streptomyces anandii JCM 4720]
MSSSLRRGALAAAAIAFSIASLAACGAGNNAQTLQVKPDNAATTVGDIKVQNATVITQPDPQSKGPAVISATVFNTGTTDQTLDSISVQGDGTAQLSPAGGKGKLTVPAGGSVVIGGKGNASAVLSNAGVAVQNGNAQQITFTFSKTGDVSLRAFVVPAKSYFDKWGPSNVPAAPGAGGTAKPSASSSTGKPSKSHAPSKSPSGSPSATSQDAGTAVTPSDSASQSASGH